MSRQRRDVTLGIDVLRPPAKFAPRLLPAQALIERVAARPFAEFGCDSYLSDARPTAEIDYPNKEAGKPPIRELVVLDRD